MEEVLRTAGKGEDLPGGSVDSLEAKVNSLKGQLATLVRQFTPGAINKGAELKAQKKYWKVQRQFQNARDKLNAIRDEESRKRREKMAKEAAKEPKSKISGRSFSEITSTTYERAMARQNREIERFIRGGYSERTIRRANSVLRNLK